MKTRIKENEPLIPVMVSVKPSHGFRILAKKTSSRFAWDIHQLQFLDDFEELGGLPISSGFAYPSNPEYYGAHRAFMSQSGFWGGRMDNSGSFWLGLEIEEPTLVNRIILEQGEDHFTSEIEIQTKNATNEWTTIGKKSDLQAGWNDIRLFDENIPASTSTDLKILVWAINESRTKMEEMCAQSIDTAVHFGIDVELFGVGTKFTEHKQRIGLLYQYLQNIHPEQIIVCMDGSDTLFNDTSKQLLEKFLNFNTRILISAEKDFTYQYPTFKAAFDSISSPYRYVNAGTFMGYAGDLLDMMNELLELHSKFPDANDQGLMGIWASLYLQQPQLMQLDTNCDVFWVTTQDWNVLEIEQSHKTSIINPFTQTYPIIIHCVGNNFPPHRKAYDKAFQHITKTETTIIPIKISF